MKKATVEILSMGALPVSILLLTSIAPGGRIDQLWKAHTTTPFGSLVLKSVPNAGNMSRAMVLQRTRQLTTSILGQSSQAQHIETWGHGFLWSVAVWDANSDVRLGSERLLLSFDARTEDIVSLAVERDDGQERTQAADTPQRDSGLQRPE